MKKLGWWYLWWLWKLKTRPTKFVSRRSSVRGSRHQHSPVLKSPHACGERLLRNYQPFMSIVLMPRILKHHMKTETSFFLTSLAVYARTTRGWYPLLWIITNELKRVYIYVCTCDVGYMDIYWTKRRLYRCAGT
jgi:hypothetical protein